MVQAFNNPFEQLADELNSIKIQLAEITELKPQAEIISDKTLCERLEVTRQTLGRWRKQNRIPFIQIGSVIRYDYNKVLEALEKKGAVKHG